MFAQYFGQFLLNEGTVSTQQLQQAIEVQQETRVMLGLLAMNQGYMNAEQVDQVHQTQMKIDKRFGEIAIDLGYLLEEQLDQLLSAQKSAHLVLGQALINMNVLTYESLSNALEDFKERYGLTDEQFASIVEGDIQTLIRTLLINNREEDKKWLVEYVSLFSKNLIRFVDATVHIELIEKIEQKTYEWMFSQSILDNGGQSKTISIAGDEQSMIKLASRYAQEPIESADEMMEASVGELLNLHNGIFLVNMSNLGIELEMKPQYFERGVESSSIKDTHIVRIHGRDFVFDLLLEDLSSIVTR
jgi:hypothetical protein